MHRKHANSETNNCKSEAAAEGNTFMCKHMTYV